VNGRLAQAAAAAWLLGVLGGCGSPTSTTVSVASPPPPSTTLPAARLADLSASVASPQSGRTLNCREDAVAQVTLTNRGTNAVAVTGVRRTTRVLSGGCGASADFTYARLPSLVGPGRATLVMEEPLYTGGVGCCTSGAGCDGRFTCAIEHSFTVLTGTGGVAAGSFGYQVNFLNCGGCSSLSAASVRSCPPSAP
jgi:hypothetical protein